METSLLLLLVASVVVAAAALLLTRIAARRGRRGPRSVLPIVGAAQLLLGVLWVAWGGIELAQNQINRSGGLLAIVLGLLSCLQGARRLFAAARAR